MSLRRTAANISFAGGCLLLAAAAALLVTARTLPSEGFEDLGWIVGAMLLAAIALLPFVCALALGRREMPRWMIVASAAGTALALVPAYALVTARLG